MPKITISYRRADSDAIAGRIRDRLAHHYGERSVFMDIDNIPFGIDFREHIKAELAENDVLIAVVGPKWLGPGKGGRQRIHDETDPVRIEIEAALQRGIPVIPILVHGAVIPKPAELPPAMQSFAFHNAAAVDTGRDFHSHMDRLIRSMDLILKRRGQSPGLRRLLPVAVATGVCASVLAVAGAWFYLAKAPQTPVPAPSVVAIVPSPTSSVVPSSAAVLPATPVPQRPELAAAPKPAPVELSSPPQPQPTTAYVPPVRPSAPSWLVEPRIAANDYQANFDVRIKEGYRLKAVSPFVADGAEYFAALWSKEAGPAWRAAHGWSAQQFQQRGDQYTQEGYRRTWISAHEFGGEVRFSGIWERRAGPPWQARFGITAAQLQSTIEDLGNAGYQPVHVYGYTKEGASNFAVILEKTDRPPATAVVKFDIPSTEWQGVFDEQSRQGYQLKKSSGYRIADKEFRAGLFEKDSGRWFSRSNTPPAGVATLSNNLFYQGYRLVYFSAFAGAGPRYNHIWENTAFSPADLSSITGRVFGYLRTHRVPNAAIAITKDGRLVYAGGFSWQAQAGLPPDIAPTNLFRIANVSKGFTTVAILKLTEAGKLSLDDKVFGPGSILGARFATPPFNTRIEKITIRHLLQRTSGFTNLPNNAVLEYSHLSPDELIRTVINEPARALTRDPGTQFVSGSIEYSVLGRVIEQVTGMRYEEYVKANVLAPIGIKDMAIGGDSQADKKPHEMSYFPAEAYSRKISNADSTAGWAASAIDLARFLVHVDGSPTKPDIISAASHALMITSSGIKDANGRDPFHGLGWYLGPQALWGGRVGSFAHIAVLPGGYTVAALTNMRPTSDDTGQNLRSMMSEIIASVKTWPSYDLFDGPQ